MRGQVKALFTGMSGAAFFALILLVTIAAIRSWSQIYSVTPQQGAVGTTGATPNITIGTVTTRSAGTGATASISGTTPSLSLSLGIPNGATGGSGSAGTAATIAVGTVSSLPTGSTPTITNSGSSSAATFNFTIPVGLTGSQGISGAGWIPAKLTTNTSGAVTWTFPAGCIGSGNPPAIVYGAEGPNPAAGTTVNVQTTGTVGVTTVAFQVTKQTATTVALLGLTIAVTAAGTGVGATVLDVGCLAQ